MLEQVLTHPKCFVTQNFKFSFLTLKVVFLGHVMTQAGTSVDPNKNYLQHRALVLFSYFKGGIPWPCNDTGWKKC